MSSNPYKGGLTVGGPAFEKSKLGMRRPTPDSDVLASSDEDRDHVPPARPAVKPVYNLARRPSSGWIQDIQPNRKYSLPSVSFAGSQPTTPSLEQPQQSRPTTTSLNWNTASFTANSAGSRLQEVLPSPTSAHHPTDRALPSPTAVEADDGISFLLNQYNPIRKSVRSQSYSVGQGEADNPAAQLASRLRTSLRHRPSKPSLLGDSTVALGQLREDDIDEVESSNGSEQGVRLPVGYWDREHRQAVLKHAAMENARARNRAPSAGSPVSQSSRKTGQNARPMTQSDYAVDEHEDNDRHDSPKMSLTRRFSEFGREVDVELLEVNKKMNWNTGAIHPLGVDALGRRHSFAHYSSHQPSNFQLSTLGNTKEEEEEDASDHQSQSPGSHEQFDTRAYFTGYGPASRAINSSAISAAHPDPAGPPPGSTSGNPYAVPTAFGRAGRRLYVVAFKCSRADIYYVYDNTGLEIRSGDLVIVEGDRGIDLGQVTHADLTMEEAKKFKAEANEEHFRWLVMFSQYSLAGNTNDSGMLGALARANPNLHSISRPQIGIGAQQDQDTKPKMIKRLAQQHEIMALRDKEGSEAKAKRVGAQKAAEHKLPMEILDAEYQADYHKLTYFYYAEAYVNFNPLVVDLFKQYKVRIWMSAVNPASVVNPVGMMQIPPPSAIGPGAIIHSSAPNASLPVGPGFGSNTYRPNEQYGRDRQHGAQGAYEESYYPFSHQLPSYASQGTYQVNQWNNQHLPPEMFGRYGFPNATGGGSPMNFGAWYPPATYSTSPAFNTASSGTSYRGGYPATTAATGHSYSQHVNAGHGGSMPNSAAPGYNSHTATGTGLTGHNNAGSAHAGQPPSNTGGHAGYGTTDYSNGFTGTPGAVSSAGHDSNLAASIATLSFGK